VPSADILSRNLAGSTKKLAAPQRHIAKLQRQETKLREAVRRLTDWAAQAAKFAYHDELTGLPNRRLLSDRIRQAAARAQRQRSQVALLFLDLDGFKKINDTLGHAAGDQLLQQVGTRLSACVRVTDTVSRYGGDEFVILLPDLGNQQGAIAAAEKICTGLEVPFLVDDTEITLTASIGLAIYPLDGCDSVELIKRSDIAMYCDKARGPPRPSVQVRERTDQAVEQHG
jgi:diguanylate cyclase (GGDEF)-like protein